MSDNDGLTQLRARLAEMRASADLNSIDSMVELAGAIEAVYLAEIDTEPELAAIRELVSATRIIARLAPDDAERLYVHIGSLLECARHETAAALILSLLAEVIECAAKSFQVEIRPTSAVGRSVGAVRAAAFVVLQKPSLNLDTATVTRIRQPLEAVAAAAEGRTELVAVGASIAILAIRCNDAALRVGLDSIAADVERRLSAINGDLPSITEIVRAAGLDDMPEEEAEVLSSMVEQRIDEYLSDRFLRVLDDVRRGELQALYEGGSAEPLAWIAREIPHHRMLVADVVYEVIVGLRADARGVRDRIEAVVAARRSAVEDPDRLIKLDDDFVEEVGWGHLQGEQRSEFLQAVYQDLAHRVHNLLASQLTDTQLAEFEQFFEAKELEGEPQALAWLEANVTEYRQIVREQFALVQVDLREKRRQEMEHSQRGIKDVIKLDQAFLDEAGLGRLPLEDRRELLKRIYTELEVRTGSKLANAMTNQQLEEFERYFNANDQDGAFAWITENFPNYKQIVSSEFGRIKRELIQAAPVLVAEIGEVEA